MKKRSLKNVVFANKQTNMCIANTITGGKEKKPKATPPTNG